jgi:hypothetical protein
MGQGTLTDVLQFSSFIKQLETNKVVTTNNSRRELLKTGTLGITGLTIVPASVFVKATGMLT